MEYFNEIDRVLCKIEDYIDKNDPSKIPYILFEINLENFLGSLEDSNDIMMICDRIFDILLECFRNSYMKSYHSIYGLFIKFISENDCSTNIMDKYEKLFTLSSKLAVTYYIPDSEEGKLVLSYEDDYSKHLDELKKILASESFIANTSGIREQNRIVKCFEDMTIDLINFINNKRADLFLSLYDFLLYSLFCIRRLTPAAACFFRISEMLPESYLFSMDNVRKDLKNIFKKYLDQDDLNSSKEYHSVLYELVFPIKEDDIDDESALTREDVMRFAFEEISGGDAMTSSEQELLDNLQSHLEISAELFISLQNEVVLKLRDSKVSETVRDFSPRAFLEKVMAKVIEDGIIDENEKILMMKLFNALKVDKEFFHNALAKASLIQKEKLKEIQSKANYKRELYRKLPDINDDLQKKYQFMNRNFGSEKIVNNILAKSDILNSQTSVKNNRIELYNEVINSSDAVFPHIMDFLYDNKVSELPVVVLFCKSENINHIMSQLKGIDLSFRIVQTDEQPDKMLIYNECIQKYIDISGKIMTDLIEDFKCGLDFRKGRFIFSVVSIETMSAMYALNCEGAIDFSGKLYESQQLMGNGECKKAIDLLDDLLKQDVKIKGLLNQIGLCYKKMAEEEIDSEKNYELAIENFQLELQSFPYYSSCQNNLSQVYNKLDRLSEAVDVIEKSMDKSPTNCAVLINASPLLFSRVLNNTLKMNEPDHFDTENRILTIIVPLIQASNIDPYNKEIWTCFKYLSDISEQLKDKGIIIKIGDLKKELFNRRTDTAYH